MPQPYFPNLGIDNGHRCPRFCCTDTSSKNILKFRYDNMKMKLAKLRTKCEKNLLEAFHTSVRDFDQWLKGKKELVQRYGDVSGNKKTAQQKLEQVQVPLITIFSSSKAFVFTAFFQALLQSIDEGKTKLNILIGLGDDLPNILRPESSENVRLQTKQCKEAWRNFLAMLQVRQKDWSMEPCRR